MQPIPVPQNIIDAEFKLFGSFTVSQFIKILVGSLIALGIFFIDINFIIKLPLMLFAVGTGFMMAIVPSFPKWFSGFMKSVFISPRYVWIKEGEAPELLTQQTVKTVEKDQSVSSALSKKKLDISSLPLEEMFATRAITDRASGGGVQKSEPVSIDPEDKLDNIMQEVFQTSSKSTLSSPVPPQPQGTGQTTQTVRARVQQEKRPLPTNPEELKAEIKRLKFELSKLARDDKFKDREEQIIAQINELYREIKLLVGQPLQNQDGRINKKLSDMVPQAKGRLVYGKIVGKRDEIISNAEVVFVNQANQQFKTLTGSDGKFQTSAPLPNGNYSVYIQAPNKRFHTYKIEVGDQDLPGYKFREK